MAANKAFSFLSCWGLGVECDLHSAREALCPNPSGPRRPNATASMKAGGSGTLAPVAAAAAGRCHRPSNESQRNALTI